MSGEIAGYKPYRAPLRKSEDLAAQPQTMEVFPPPHGPAPSSPAGGGRRTHRRKTPPSESPAHLNPTGPTSLVEGFSFFLFFFWRQISIGYFPGFGDLTEGARQEFRDSRGVKAHLYARAPPPLG